MAEERTTSTKHLTGKTIVAAHLKHASTELILTLSGGAIVTIESRDPAGRLSFNVQRPKRAYKRTCDHYKDELPNA